MRRVAQEKFVCSSIAGRLLAATLLEFAIVVSTCRAFLGTSDSISLRGNDSYVVYPHWTLSPGAQTTISFLTSEENGTLLFVDTVAGFVHVSLEAGNLLVRSRAAGRLVVPGKQLNDDAPHHLLVSLSNDACSLRLQLVEPGANLSLTATQLDCTPPTSYEPRSSLYFGGVPSNFSQSGSLVPFAGCLLGVTTSLSNGPALLPPVVSSEGATLDACRTPCDDVTTCAHNASCAYRWGAQATATCDCRDALLVGAGPSCSDDPASVSRVTLDGTSYHCFHLPQDTPYLIEPERSIVQLLPGHPEIGTIMTGTSGESPSSSISFSLYLTDRRLTLSLRGPHNSTQLNSQVTLVPQWTYQVEVTIDAFFVTMVTTNITFSAMPSIVDNITMTLPQSLSAVKLDCICVGGGALEVPLYRGSLQTPYHRRYALGETRNFAALRHELVPRSSVLSFLPYATDPPLALYQLSKGLSFQFLTELPGPLLTVASDGYLFDILVGTEQVLFISLADKRHGNNTYFTSSELDLTDGGWHTFELAKVEEEEGAGQVWTLYIDNVTCFVCPGNGCGQVLDSLSSAPIWVGWKTQGFIGGNPVPFTGCMKDFKFPNDASLNLEVMARRAPARFSVDGCPGQIIPASFVPPTPSESFLISATSSLLLLQSPDYYTTHITTTTPDHSTVHITTTRSLTIASNRKRLYAAIAVFGVLVLILVAAVCAVILLRYRRHLATADKLAEHRTQNMGLPKLLT